MRRYDILFGILLIISITDFALAAPVPVQEKHQARVDVAHIPKDAVTVLGKRMDENLESLKKVAQYLETIIKPAESSDAHASSSSAPLGTEHGSKDAVQAASPNPASPTANPGLMMDPSSPPSTAQVEEWWKGRASLYDTFSNKASDWSDEPLFTPGSSGYGSDHESMENLPKLNPIRVPRPVSTGADPGFDWDYWNNVVNDSPPKEVGQAHGSPSPAPSTGANPNEDFDWDYWNSVVNESPPKEVGHVHGYPVPGQSTGTVPDFHLTDEADPLVSSPTGFDKVHDVYLPTSFASPDSFRVPGWAVPPTSPGARLPTVPEHELAPSPSPDTGSPKTPENENVASPPPLDLGPLGEPEHEAIPGPPTSPNPEFDLNHQPPSTASQPVDLPDLPSLVYAAKGKAIQSRRISGTARDINMRPRAARELPAAEALKGVARSGGVKFLSRRRASRLDQDISNSVVLL